MIPCKGQTVRKPGYISKVMNHDNALEEYSEAQKMDRIDPRGIFHILQPQMCKIADKYHTEPGMEDCIPYKKFNDIKQVSVLQYKDGGEDFSEFLKNVTKDSNMNSETTKKILRGMRPLFHGLDIMYKAEYVHLDIKRANIVIHADTYECKYIDFGLSTELDTISERDYLFKAVYFAHPSEILYNVFKPEVQNVSLHNFQKAIRKIVKKLNVSRPYAQEFNNENVFNGHLYNTSFTLEKIAHYKHMINTLDTDTLNRQLCEKIDVFSLGIVMMSLYIELADTMYNMTPTRQYAPLKSELFKLIKKMIEPLYSDRPNGTEIYVMYVDKIWPLIQPGSRTISDSGGGGGGAKPSSSAKPSSAKPSSAKPSSAKPSSSAKSATVTRCKGKSEAVCNTMDNCKFINGNKRKYCRKSKNKPRRAARPKPKPKSAAKPKPKPKSAAKPKPKPRRAAKPKPKPRRAAARPKSATITRCRGKPKAECDTTANCKFTNGAKRKFCRKSKNRRSAKAPKARGGGAGK
jgi:serine/threonine protein kinase